jgi:hypothetical protein
MLKLTYSIRTVRVKGWHPPPVPIITEKNTEFKNHQQNTQVLKEHLMTNHYVPLQATEAINKITSMKNNLINTSNEHETILSVAERNNFFRSFNCTIEPQLF